jgi:hypothetical protein
MSLATEDRAERLARQKIHKRGKRMFVLLCISAALYLGVELLHRLFGFPPSAKAVLPIVGLLAVFACGDAFSLPEVWVDEFRTRMKEIDCQLAELKATLEELKGRL